MRILFMHFKISARRLTSDFAQLQVLCYVVCGNTIPLKRLEGGKSGDGGDAGCGKGAKTLCQPVILQPEIL